MGERLVQFNNLSSWQDADYLVKGGEVLTIDFLEKVAPNQFVLQNSNNVKLHVSISNIPTLTRYEFIVDKNSYGVFGRPTETRKLYVFNTGTSDANIKLFSVNKPFDMNILKDFNVSTGDLKVATDGIVKGFQSGVMLPKGTNNIGSVSIDDEDMILFETIGQDIDDINGNVGEMKTSIASNLDNTNTIVSLLQAISESGIGGGTGTGGSSNDYTDKLNRLLHVNGAALDKEPVYSYNEETFEVQATEDCVVHLNYYMYDGDTYATFYKGDNTASAIFKVYSGENITDMEIELKANERFYVTTDSGTHRAKYFVY